MTKKTNVKRTDAPVKSHIICEGKKASSITRFELGSSDSETELKPIYMTWTSDDSFTHIFS